MPITAKDVDKALRASDQNSGELEGKLLKSGITYTEGMKKTAKQEARELFPFTDEPKFASTVKTAAIPLRAGVNGLLALPEDTIDAGLGFAQQSLGVPQEKRVTIGDIGRMIPGFKDSMTAAEFMRSPQYQQAAQANPVQGAMSDVSEFVGSMFTPIGGAMGAIGRIGTPIAEAATKIPAVAKTLPVIQHGLGAIAAPGSRLAQAAAQQPLMRLALPTVQHALSGAGWAAGLGAGSQFGATKQMPSTEQTIDMLRTGALAGGALSVGIRGGAALGRQLGAMFSRRNVPQNLASPAALPQSAQQQSMPLNGSAISSASDDEAALLMSLGMPVPGQLNPISSYQRALSALLLQRAQGNKDIFPIDRAARNILSNANRIASQEGANNQNAQKTILTMNKEYIGRLEKQQRAEQTVSENALNRQQRSDLQTQRLQAAQQQQLNRSEQQRTNISSQEGKLASHSEASGEMYRSLYNAIENANSKEELRSIERDVHDAGVGAGGKSLLHTYQRNNLMKQFRKKFKRLGGKPGESQADAFGSEMSAEYEAEPNVASVNQTNNPLSTEISVQTPADKFVAGSFRKTLSKNYRGANEYKLASSVESIIKLGHLTHEEGAALTKWVRDLHENAVEQKAIQLKLQQYGKWATEHADELEPNPNFLLDMYEKSEHEGQALLARIGEVRRILFESRLRYELTNKGKHALALKRAELLLEGQRRGDVPLVMEHDPKIVVSVNGTTAPGGWHEKLNGGLETLGVTKFQAPEFKEPKNLDDLYDRVTHLKKYEKHFDEEMAQIKGAKAELDHAGSPKPGTGYDYLGDGRTPLQIMNGIFNRRKDLWQVDPTKNQIPTARIWHVDEFGNVSTTTFHQRAKVLSFSDRAADLEKRYDEFIQHLKTDFAGGNAKKSRVYSTQWLRGAVKSFSGLEALPIVAMWAYKGLHPLIAGTAKSLSRTRVLNLQALAVGTIDDILKANPQFQGHLISTRLHQMMGRIFSNIVRDDGKLYEQIHGAEDLTNMLNEFKGLPHDLGEYGLHAIRQAKVKGQNVQASVRRARTAFMVRSEFKRLAQIVGPVAEEFDARRKDLYSPNGYLHPERRGRYRANQFDSNGRLSATIYDGAFHEALNKLHEALTLQGEGGGGLAALMGRLASRKSAQIFGLNFRTGISNWFDALPVQLAEYEGHWFNGLWDVMKNRNIRNFVDKLPIVAQIDMESVRLEEERLTRPAPNNTLEKMLYKYEDLVAAVGKDRIGKYLFHGREWVVSAADRFYSQVGSVASLRRQAKELGVDVNWLVNELRSGTHFNEKERATILGRVSEDVTKTLNSVMPHLNKDLVASSKVGKLLFAWSGPQRVQMRYWFDLMKSGEPKKIAKAALGYMYMVSIAGRGAIPKSVRFLGTVLAAQAGVSLAWERFQHELDDKNVLRAGTHWDFTERAGPDFLNMASPFPDAVQKWNEKAVSKAARAKTKTDYLNQIMDFNSTFALVPRINGFGTDYLTGLVKRLESANENKRTYYVHTPNGDIPISIPGYTTYEALMETLTPYLPSKVVRAQEKISIQQARKLDALHKKEKPRQAQKKLFPERNENIDATLLPLRQI